MHNRVEMKGKVLKICSSILKSSILDDRDQLAGR